VFGVLTKEERSKMLLVSVVTGRNQTALQTPTHETDNRGKAGLC
jgi:hypothetical protein